MNGVITKAGCPVGKPSPEREKEGGIIDFVKSNSSITRMETSIYSQTSFNDSTGLARAAFQVM